MIIAISGKIGNGKDTVGKIIQYLDASTRVDMVNQKEHITIKDLINSKFLENSNWQIRKFADKLKDIVCLLIGCSREQLEDQEFKNKMLGEEWWYYNSISGMIPYRDSLDTNIELIKLTPRKLLQLLGTECGREIIHPNIWINSLFVDYKKEEKNNYWVVGYGTDCDGFNNGTISGFIHEKDAIKYCNEQNEWSDGIQYSIIDNIEDAQNYCDEFTIIVNQKVQGPQVPLFSDIENDWIITDCRFPNEAQAIKDRGGILIRVNRPTLDARQDHEHESETALDNAEFDYVIDNNSTIEELIVKVKDILIKEKLL